MVEEKVEAKESDRDPVRREEKEAKERKAAEKEKVGGFPHHRDHQVGRDEKVAEKANTKVQLVLQALKIQALHRADPRSNMDHDSKE